MEEGLVQRHIVFIDQQNHFLPVVLVEQGTERLQAVQHVFPRVLLAQKALERLLIRFVHGRAFQQKAQPRHLPAQGAAQRVISAFEIWAVHALEREGNHGALAQVFLAQILFPGDGQAVEKRGIRADLKEAFEHAHVEGLAKAARAGEEVHLAPIPEQIADQARFIDIVKIFPADFRKVLDAHRQLFVLHLRNLLALAVCFLSYIVPQNCFSGKFCGGGIYLDMVY